MTERGKLHIRAYQAGDEKDVIQLWHDCNLVVPWME